MTSESNDLGPAQGPQVSSPSVAVPDTWNWQVTGVIASSDPTRIYVQWLYDGGPAKPEPQGPSDAEIVAEWEHVQRGDGGHSYSRDGVTAGLVVAGVRVDIAACSAAWSRELQRLGREAEARKVRPLEQYDELVGEDVAVGMSELCDPFSQEWR